MASSFSRRLFPSPDVNPGTHLLLGGQRKFFSLWSEWGSNRGPLAPQSNALTIRPRRLSVLDEDMDEFYQELHSQMKEIPNKALYNCPSYRRLEREGGN